MYKPTVKRKCEVCGAEFFGLKIDHYFKRHPEFKIRGIMHTTKGGTKQGLLACMMPGCSWTGNYSQLIPHYRRCHSGQIKPAIIKIEPAKKTSDVLFIADLISQLNGKIVELEKREKGQDKIISELTDENKCLRAKLEEKQQEVTRLDAGLLQAQELLLRK